MAVITEPAKAAQPPAKVVAVPGDVTPTELTPVANAPANDPAVKKETHERVLAESKKFKDRAIAAEKKVQEAEAAKLEAEGKHKERADLYQERYNNLSQSLMKDRISLSVKSEAAKAGAVNPDDVFRLGQSDLLQYDESTGVVHGVDLFVSKLKETSPYLFKKDAPPTINPVTPTAGPVVAGKPTGALSQDEIREKLHALEAQGVR